VNLKVPITGTIASDAGPLTVQGTTRLVIQPQDPTQPGTQSGLMHAGPLGGLSVDFQLNVNHQGIVTGATAVALDPE
jgi:hypothetical protein